MQYTPTIASNSSRSGVRARAGRRRRLAIAIGTAALAGSGLFGSPADAEMAGEAVVECNSSYNTIEVTPRVLSDHADTPQWTATRVWLATWNGSTRTWGWEAQQWKVELASEQNSPIATDIARLETQQITRGDGYYYVYVESWMWDGSTWYGWDGDYTRTYTQVTPSVSHEPDGREAATYCTL